VAQDRDDMIRSYVSRVMEVRERREGAMRAEDLRAIARDIGLSEEDLAAAEQEALDHIARGRQFLQHGRPDDAIAALSKAVALAPDQLDARIDLAQALRDRFRRTGRDEDRAASISQARACIDQDPSCQRAYLLLNELDQPAVGAGSSGAGVGALIAAALGAVILLGGVAAVGFLTFASSSSSPMPPEVITYEPASSAEPAEPPVEPPAVTTAQPASAPQLPLEVKLPANSGLTATVISSQYDYYEYNKTGYYKGVVELRNDLKEKAFTELPGTLRLLGGDGANLAADSNDQLSMAGNNHMMPGDTLSISLFEELKVAPERVVFEVAAPKTTLAKLRSSPPTQLSWDVETPFKERVTMSTRRFAFNRYNNAAKGYASLALELRVSGDTPVKEGKLRIELLNARGELITHKPLYLPGLSGGPIRPDTVRLISGTWESEVDVASVRVVVEEIE
jgi:hypothetical protein